MKAGATKPRSLPTMLSSVSDGSKTAVVMNEEQMKKNIMEKLKKMKEAVDCGEECEDPDEKILLEQF